VIDSSGWDWFDEQLTHPAGRAIGGEPCVVCGHPVPAGAHWKHRDRHVCSARCNTTVRRRLNRRIGRGELCPPVHAPPHLNRGGVVFGTDPSAEFPYEFLGWAPLVGDVVERHGSVTGYEAAEPLRWDDGEHPVAHCLHFNTGATAIVKVESDGRVGGVWYRCFDPAGVPMEVRTPFTHDGSRWIWTWETFRDADADDQPYSWSAPICVAKELAWPLWTPAFTRRSALLERVSSSTARHARRQRMAGTEGRVERIDPLAVYERDGWVCQLCTKPLDRELRHPDPGSPSLDHRIPLVAGGRHEVANVWTAHLRCNLRKGARLLP
jgi:hypothetical protein